jgi:hypothetical protein
MKSEVQILRSHELDFKKWDNCVASSPNCLVYGLSEYLNFTADNWTGVVVDDYASVMPVPWRRKLGVTYSYCVPFLQQSGIFSTHSGWSVDSAKSAIASICTYGDYYFNFGQQDEFLPAMTNFILPLEGSYDELQRRFTPDARQIISKCKQSSMAYATGEIDEAVSLYAAICRARLKISAQQYDSFAQLCKTLAAKDAVVVRKVTDPKGNTLSIMLLVKFQKRLYNVLNSTTDAGRELRSNYLLYACAFEEFENQDYLFDFEGSDHPGINAFYRQFSPVNQHYYRYHFNDLPLIARILKR